MAETGSVVPSPDLSHISVVLVRPRQPENVGFVARAMANFGLGTLVLVRPQVFDPERARWSAPGAHHVIDQARIVGSVEAAVAGHAQVFGTTARARRIEQEVWGPSQLCREVIHRPLQTALLFGPEDSGLKNTEIACCRSLIRIPTTEQSSLNLAQAVTVLCALLRSEALGQEPAPRPPVSPQNMALHELLIY